MERRNPMGYFGPGSTPSFQSLECDSSEVHRLGARFVNILRNEWRSRPSQRAASDTEPAVTQTWDRYSQITRSNVGRTRGSEALAAPSSPFGRARSPSRSVSGDIGLVKYAKTPRRVSWTAVATDGYVVTTANLLAGTT